MDRNKDAPIAQQSHRKSPRTVECFGPPYIHLAQLGNARTHKLNSTNKTLHQTKHLANPKAQAALKARTPAWSSFRYNGTKIAGLTMVGVLIQGLNRDQTKVHN